MFLQHIEGPVDTMELTSIAYDTTSHYIRF